MSDIFFFFEFKKATENDKEGSLLIFLPCCICLNIKNHLIDMSFTSYHLFI